MSEFDDFISDEFPGLVSNVQDQAVAALDKRFAEERAFRQRQRQEEQSKSVSMSELLAVSEEDAGKKQEALDKANAQIIKDAAEAAKAKEPGNVRLEDSFPAPVITEQ